MTWVLEGAIDFYEPKIAQLFKGLIKIEQPEIETEVQKAKAYYRSLR